MSFQARFQPFTSCCMSLRSCNDPLQVDKGVQLSQCRNKLAVLIACGFGEQAGEATMQPVAQAVTLKGLKIHLGPELRAMFPVVLNMSISGDIELNGAADPASLKLAGIIHLDGGEARPRSDAFLLSLICFGMCRHVAG